VLKGARGGCRHLAQQITDALNTEGRGLSGTIPTEIGLMTDVTFLYGPPFFLFHPSSSAPTFGISPWRSAQSCSITLVCLGGGGASALNMNGLSGPIPTELVFLTRLAWFSVYNSECFSCQHWKHDGTRSLPSLTRTAWRRQ
jgi:hypothetical protein